jgi:hypothetical protein
LLPSHVDRPKCRHDVPAGEQAGAVAGVASRVDQGHKLAERHRPDRLRGLLEQPSLLAPHAALQLLPDLAGRPTVSGLCSARPPCAARAGQSAAGSSQAAMASKRQRAEQPGFQLGQGEALEEKPAGDPTVEGASDEESLLGR